MTRSPAPGRILPVLLAAVLSTCLSAPAFADPAPLEATAVLSALRYTDANNWFFRSIEASAADNAPDALNRVHYYDVHRQSASNSYSANGVVQAWGLNSTQARDGDRHWNGSTWVACPLGTRNSASVRDAQGRHDYNYCDGRDVGRGVRRIVDISGRSLVSVVRDQIRGFPGGNNGVAFSSWGPSNLNLYGSATFPNGSHLQYQSNTITATAYAYDVQSSNVVSVYPANIAAGGDARSTPTVACNISVAAAAAAVQATTSLEMLVARNPGKPCIFGPGGVAPDLPLNPSEWWSNSTASLGTLAGANTLPPGTGNHYSTTANLRVAFAASGNGARFYSCYRRASDGSTRNCTLMGLGTWSIQVLGDGRVLSFSTAPALAQRLGYARVFVERGGKVYFGYKNPVGVVDTDVRLNLPAANAVLRQLGLPSIQPVTQPGTATGERAAALAMLKGVWGAANDTEAIVFRFGDNGRMLMAEAKPYKAATREQSGAELGWLDYDPATHQISTLLESDSSLTSGTSNPGAVKDKVTITATALILANGGVQLPRLETAATGLVGLWALDSATDLRTTHLAFFSNGRFMLIDPTGAPDDPSCGAPCPAGAEFSLYTFNPQTSVLRLFGKIYDTNGCAGAFESCASGGPPARDSFPIQLAPDGKTFTMQFEDGTTHTLYRIAQQ